MSLFVCGCLLVRIYMIGLRFCFFGFCFSLFFGYVSCECVVLLCINDRYLVSLFSSGFFFCNGEVFDL